LRRRLDFTRRRRRWPTVLDKALLHWNRSVEQLVYYLAETYGRSELLAALAKAPDGSNERADTMRWWLGASNEDR